MNTLADGIQLEATTNIDTFYALALTIGLMVLAGIFFAIGFRYSNKIDKDKNSVTKLGKATMIGSHIIAIIAVFATAISLVNLADNSASTKSESNITKVKDSYGITLNNDNANRYTGKIGNKDAVGDAETGAYYISRENLTNGTVDNYKITIDEHKVLRVFQPKNKDTKTWVEVKPQQ
jgi:hypothetical protein